MRVERPVRQQLDARLRAVLELDCRASPNIARMAWIASLESGLEKGVEEVHPKLTTLLFLDSKTYIEKTRIDRTQVLVEGIVFDKDGFLKKV